MKIITHIAFEGNCREAMNFYKDCLGGELEFSTVAETPMAEQMPAEAHNNILHSVLTTDGAEIMGSDFMMGETPERGNAYTVTIVCDSEGQIKELFDNLSVGGQVTMPLDKTFWAEKFGMLVDKYGVSWMLNLDSDS